MEKDKLWNAMHEKLQQSMKQEIEMMREILANMHQEEDSLLINDKATWTRVMQERVSLIHHLSDLREARIETTQQLELLAHPYGAHEELSLEELLPPQDELSCETLILKDQIIALSERLNLQHLRNETLYNLAQHQGEQPQLQPLPVPPKPRISIATLPPKEESY